jgi:hypothetical protein
MTTKFTFYQREMIKQLVLEADIQRLTGEEMHAYVKGRLREDISLDYLHVVKKNLRRNIGARLNQLREHKTMFINELFFRRRDELEKYQKELWRIYLTHPNDAHLQTDCIREMHKVTVTLCQIYSELPMISGLTFFTSQQRGGDDNGEKVISRAVGTGTWARQSSEEMANGSDVSGNDYRPVV